MTGELISMYPSPGRRRWRPSELERTMANAEIDRFVGQIQMRRADQRLTNKAEVAISALNMIDELSYKAVTGTMAIAEVAMVLAQKMAISPVELGMLMRQNIEVKSKIIRRFGQDAEWIIGELP